RARGIQDRTVGGEDARRDGHERERHRERREAASSAFHGLRVAELREFGGVTPGEGLRMRLRHTVPPVGIDHVAYTNSMGVIHAPVNPETNSYKPHGLDHLDLKQRGPGYAADMAPPTRKKARPSTPS